MKRGAAILVVDDEPRARDTMEALLSADGHELSFACDGEEALAHLANTPVDVVLLDVMMPRMDGFEVCRRIKADKWLSHIPVVLVTALDEREHLVRGMDAGAEEFLSKPVGGVELRARVRAMVRIKRQFDELAAVVRLRDEIAHMIVHDMHNPLTVLLGASDSLLGGGDGLLSPFALEDIKNMQRAAQRLHAISDQLLMVSKLEHGKFLLNLQPTSLHELIVATARTLEPIARAKAISVRIDPIPSDLPHMGIDRSLIKRVLENLVSNAIKCSPPASMITLRAIKVSGDDRGPGHIVVEVRDEGRGVAQAHRETIFDKFAVVEEGVDGGGPRGLGLYFCRLVIDAHGGRIWVEPNEPKGAVFRIEL